MVSSPYGCKLWLEIKTLTNSPTNVLVTLLCEGQRVTVLQLPVVQQPERAQPAAARPAATPLSAG